MMKRLRAIHWILAVFAVVSLQGAAEAKDFQGEIVAVQGDAFVVRPQLPRAPIEKGALVSRGDSLETGASSFVNVGFDKSWKNVIHVGENALVRVDDLYPLSFALASGEVLARLDALPKDSTFEVKTPVGLVGVRGSACLVRFRGGAMTVENFHEHAVLVFAITNGRLGEPVSVGRFEKADVAGGAQPAVAKMSADEVAALKEAFGSFEASVEARAAEGNSAVLDDAASIASSYAQNLESRVGASSSETREGGLPERETPPSEDQRAGNTANMGGGGGGTGGGFGSGGGDGGGGGTGGGSGIG